MARVLVGVRARPPSGPQREDAVRCAPPDTVLLRSGLHHNIKRFAFDAVYTPSDTTRDVYESMVRPLVLAAAGASDDTGSVASAHSEGGATPTPSTASSSGNKVSPRAGTLMCYGQSGSGKTHTVFDDQGGVVALGIDELFSTLQETQDEFTVFVEMLEVYSEQIYDLLRPASAEQEMARSGKPVPWESTSTSRAPVRRRPPAKGLKFLSNPFPQVYRPTHVIASSKDEALDIIRVALRHRHTADKEAFEESGVHRSSRAHCVVSLYVKFGEQLQAWTAEPALSTMASDADARSQFSRVGSPADEPETPARSVAESHFSFTREGSREGSREQNQNAFFAARNRTMADGRLTFVDLAGSERSVAQHLLAEAKCINAGLQSLGAMVQALSSAAEPVHYRQSPLTRLLYGALVPSSTLVRILCTVHTDAVAWSESQSTLFFGQSCRRMVGRKDKSGPRASQTAAEAQLARENAMLRTQLNAAEHELKKIQKKLMVSETEREQLGTLVLQLQQKLMQAEAFA